MIVKLELAGIRVPITMHLLGRWQELTCPLAPFSEAARRLAWLVEHTGAVADKPPAWAFNAGAVMWCVFGGGDYCIPVVVPDENSPYRSHAFFAPTIYARGMLTPALRERRSSERRARHGATRQKSRATQYDRRSGARAKRRGARAPDVGDWT